MEEQPTMESVLRTLREMQEPKPDEAPRLDSPVVMEEVERTIRE
jgi:hypothetical protein